MRILIKRKTIDITLLIFIIVMNILGSYFYVISKSFSVGFVCLPVLGLFLIKYHRSLFIRIRGEDVYFIVFFILFFSLSLISIMFYPIENNFRVLKFLILMIFVFFTLKLLDNSQLDKVAVIATFIITSILLLQYTFLFLGIGLNPSKDNPTSIFNMLPTSVYGNPNDLSIIGLLLFLYFSRKYTLKYKTMLMLLTGLIVLIAASRSSILLLIIVLLLNFNIKKIKLSNILAVLVLGFFFLYLGIGILDSFQYTVNRITSIVSHFDLTNVSQYGSDSMSLRINSLIFFVENLFNISFGSMIFKDYNFFFKGSLFHGQLMAENPHNFFVEISLLYGWFGVIMSVYFILFLFIGLKNEKHRMIIFLILLISLTVISSVINFLPIWVLIFMIILNNEKSSKFSF